MTTIQNIRKFRYWLWDVGNSAIPAKNKGTFLIRTPLFSIWRGVNCFHARLSAYVWGWSFSFLPTRWDFSLKTEKSSFLGGWEYPIEERYRKEVSFWTRIEPAQ